MEQTFGLKIEANSILRQELSTISNGDERTRDLIEKHQIEVLRQTGGIVKSYDLISVEDTGNRSVNALLRVRIERYSTPGLPTQDRRRIVVAQPANLASADPAQIVLMRDVLNSYLVQTRRFAVSTNTSGNPRSVAHCSISLHCNLQTWKRMRCKPRPRRSWRSQLLASAG